MKMTMDEYLARGGKITACPPRVCAHGCSPHTPDHALGWISQGVCEHGTGDFVINERHRRSASRLNALRGTEARVRREAMLAGYRAAKDKLAWIEEHAKTAGMALSSVRRILTEAGEKPPSAAAAKVRVLTKAEEEAALAMRRQGMSIDSIGRDLHVGRRLISALINERGMTFREAPDKRRAHEAAMDYLARFPNATIRTISQEHNLSYNAVKHAVARIREGGK